MCPLIACYMLFAIDVDNKATLVMIINRANTFMTCTFIEDNAAHCNSSLGHKVFPTW